jgi:uracil-DNA glycosylase
MEVNIHPSWKQALEPEFNKPYFKELVEMLRAEKQSGKKIYPPGSFIFNAFEQTPIDQVRVVLLGQDPYHGPGQAHGMSFSVPHGIKPPPSLVNIFKELKSDIGLVNTPTCGDLTAWAQQGVLLLNASLTVRDNEPNSHANLGWAPFTDAVIETISRTCEHVVFILWGKFAQQKTPLIDQDKHCILASAHPSPFSADKGFFGSKPFSKTNEWLIAQGVDPIDWALS